MVDRMSYNPNVGGGGVSDGDKGDVTVSGTGATWTIDAQAVTLAKLANLAQDTVIGRVTAGTGVPEALTASQARTVLGLGGSAVLAVGTTAGTVAAGDDSRMTNARTPTAHVHAPSDITGTAVVTADARLSDARTPTAHAASHVNGTDDIQSATAAQKGLATAAQITKLDGIAAGANNYAHPNHTGDVTSTGDGVTAIASGVIVNDDINASAAIALSKMANLAANSLVGNNTGSPAAPVALTTAQAKTLLAIANTDVSGLGTLATQSGTFSGTSSGTNTGDNAVNSLYSGLVSNQTHTGDVTGATALTIAADAVTYAKMQNVSAASRVLGRGSAGGAGDPEELTIGSGLALTGTVLSATGGGVSDGDKGDITVSASGATWTVDDGAVTYAKIQDVSAASRLLGRGGASGAGDVQEITIGTGMSLSGTALNCTVTGGGNATFLSGDITTTSTSNSAAYSAVTGSAVTVEAGKTYQISWRLSTYSAANTTGIFLRRILAGGAVGTVHGWHSLGMSNATAVIAHSSREGTNDRFGATGNATSSTTAKGSYWVDCLFVCTTGGTLGVEMTTEVNTSLATIDGDGSYWTAIVRDT
jgi:hypothetical protein